VVNKTADQPLVKDKVITTDAPEPSESKRTGFMKGKIEVPDNFDRMGEEIIEELFGINTAPVK